MKSIIQIVSVILVTLVPVSAVNAYHVFNGTSVSVGVSGGSGSFYYSRRSYNRYVNYQRTVIRVGNGGHYGGDHSVYHDGEYYRSGMQRHIHRQEGRRYVNDVPCLPVVVVPATNRYHRHYRGCGCRY